MNQQSILKILLVSFKAGSQEKWTEVLKARIPCLIMEASFDLESELFFDKQQLLPALILLDLTAEEGLTRGPKAEDFLKKIRNDPRLQPIPVVLLTKADDHQVQNQMTNLGADDYVENTAPKEILVSRIRAQLRHSVAAQRLERIAIERDLFAAGVLYDIAFAKNTITDLCRQVQELVKKDLLSSIPQIRAILGQLKSEGSGLGAYAADVIQSLKDGTREPKIASVSLKNVIEWYQNAQQSSASLGAEPLNFLWREPENECQILADQSFLKVIFLNLARIFAEGGAPNSHVVQLQVDQKRIDAGKSANSSSTNVRAVCVSQLACDEHSMTDQDLHLLQNSQIAFYSDQHGSVASWALARKVTQKMGGQLWIKRNPSGSGAPKGILIGLELPAADRL